MAAVELTDHAAGLQFQRCKQPRSPMSLVVVGAPLGLAGSHRKQRLSAVQRVAKSMLDAAGQDLCSRPASSTSRTLRASDKGVKGFWRKAVLASSTPWRTTESSVYPDM